MDYSLLTDTIHLLEKFEAENSQNSIFSADIQGFTKWIAAQHPPEEPIDWEGKSEGRSPDSVISTMLVHLNRYGRMYAKSAIQDSPFSTQDDFIFLINLRAFGEMTKMELIKKNIQDKPTGMQIINRLIRHGWVSQRDSDTDKRSKIIAITQSGQSVLDQQMGQIRKATRIVSGHLSSAEKTALIRILDKLEQFHHPIYLEYGDGHARIDEIYSNHFPAS